MLFNSLNFLFFILVVFLSYYILLNGKSKLQNIFLLLAGYAFYALANWKILPLLILSTLIFYKLGLLVYQEKHKRRKSLYVFLGVSFALGALGYFKYSNFFLETVQSISTLIGLKANIHTLKIIVPVGISFYTFRLLSYLIDINRGKYEPCTNLVTFSTYVSFFPCILSGPIDKPNTFIPQLEKARIFNYQKTTEGLRIFLWGLFNKMVIADHCANSVNGIYDNYETSTTGTLILGVFLFSFQMYADFSGYTNMAIGVSKILGLEVTKNFNRPYLATNIAEFWRRWHISLTSWLTDYVFMPLNIKWRNLGKAGIILAIVVNFILCGLWHGANWTFVLWGAFHGVLFIPLILNGSINKKKKIETSKIGFPKLISLAKVLLTFSLVSFSLIIFRADSLEQAFAYIHHLFVSVDSDTAYSAWNIYELKYSILFITLLMIYEYLSELKGDDFLSRWFIRIPKIFRWSVYLILALCIVYLGVYGSGNDNSFIYFKF